jgi:hypothetical protein
MYGILPWDNAEAVASKFTQLQRRLTEIVGQAERGRGDGVAVDPKTGLGIAPPPPADESIDDILGRWGD